MRRYTLGVVGLICVGMCGLSARAAEGTARPKTVRDRLVLSEGQRENVRRAVARLHERYDPAERMLKRPFSSPGYHTTLSGGFVHGTRDSLHYAVACLDSGDEQLRQRAEDILRRVIALQDKDPKSRTYGIWSWFLEEPLEKMSPPDWNWADFCGHALLQVALDHRERISPELMKQVDETIQHAARSVQRRNVSLGYTNIAVLGTYVTLVSGELYGIEDLKQYAGDRLKRLHEYTMRQGAFNEYNSPTYTIVSLEALTQLRTDITDPQANRRVDDMLRLAWEEIAFHFHAPTRQWAGPHSRCYSTLLSSGTLALIGRATEGRVDLGLGDHVPAWDEPRVRVSCPRDLEERFVKLEGPRMFVKAFAAGQNPPVGSTYLHPQFALGSINRGDLWNQRRALLAYWGTHEKPSYLHVRLLHNGYDFSAAQFYAAQKEGRVLAGVNFATDGGDRHISLDRIKNGTIRAKDLRVRFELGGAAAQTPITVPQRLGEPVMLRFGDLKVKIAVSYARWDQAEGRWEVSRSDKAQGLDVVLYQGEEKAFRLAELAEAAVGLGVELTTGDLTADAPTAKVAGGQLRMGWDGLGVDLAVRPDKAGVLGRTSKADMQAESGSAEAAKRK